MNILYGVLGEGMGHATRSKVVIDFLLQQNYNVHIESSAKAFQFLKNPFPERITEIKGLHFTYKNGKIYKSGTFLLNIKASGKNLIFNIAKELAIKNSFKQLST